MPRANKRQRPIMIEMDGQLLKSDVFASEAEQPVEVSIRIREKGWVPYRVRFDESQAAWIVSSLYSGLGLRKLSAASLSRS
jgi:hypothetical protein